MTLQLMIAAIRIRTNTATLNPKCSSSHALPAKTPHAPRSSRATSPQPRPNSTPITPSNHRLLSLPSPNAPISLPPSPTRKSPSPGIGPPPPSTRPAASPSGPTTCPSTSGSATRRAAPRCDPSGSGSPSTPPSDRAGSTASGPECAPPRWTPRWRAWRVRRTLSWRNRGRRRERWFKENRFLVKRERHWFRNLREAKLIDMSISVWRFKNTVFLFLFYV